MALSSIAFRPLLSQIPSSHTSEASLSKSHNPRKFLHPITASISGRPSVKPPLPPQPPLAAAVVPNKPRNLPIREIPGDYGLPLIGPWLDRQDYFYNQGRDDYFKSRVQKYQSTVFRANMPPGSFIASDPKVIVLLDGKSFPVLFDCSKVEKRDVFTGTYMPSTDLTGGYRVLSYLDPSEPHHAKLKKLIFFQLSSRRDYVIPEFQNCYSELFDLLEKELATKGKSSFNDGSEQAAFNFLARSLYGADPIQSKLGNAGPKKITKWVLFQLHPVLTLRLPGLIEDPLMHYFRFPPFLVKKDYQSIYDFFYENSGFVFDEADKIGISREEACHNLIYATCFNAFGGMKIFFPNMIKWVGRAGVKLHTDLAQEIRTVLRSSDGKLTMKAVENMPLVKSVVYESLRIEPPVPAQYAKAKTDFVLESHNAAFRVKAGEMLFGFQPFATKDPKIFDRPEEFLPERFMGEEGEKLLQHVLWSNGPETASPTVSDKQCAGKDLTVLVSRLLLVELFRRYDSFDIDVGPSPLGASITVTSLKRASF